MKTPFALVSLAVVLVAALAHAEDPEVIESGDAAAPLVPPPAPREPVPFNRHWLEPYFAADPLQTGAARFRLEDWAGAVVAWQRALARLSPASAEWQPARFLLAQAKMNLSLWEEAGSIFEDLWSTYPLLAPYHAYYAARCRVRRGDPAGALDWASRVPSRSVPEAEAILVKLDALAAQKNWLALDNEATRFLERFPAGPRRAEAMFHRGEALENQHRPVAEAIAVYRRIWTEAPLESWSARADERLKALAATQPAAEAALARNHSGEEYLSRGMVLFDRNQNGESESLFAAALRAGDLTPALACRAQYHRAQSVWKQRQRGRAAPLFGLAEAACRAASDTDLTVKSLYQGARCLASLGDRPGALARYAKIEEEFSQHSYADDARLRAAEVTQDGGDVPGATALLAGLVDRYPNGDLAGEAMWRLAWQGIKTAQPAQAHHWLDENLQRIPRESVWYAEGRALYWKGRLYDKAGDRTEALRYYSQAVHDYPLSVYALLALERLGVTAPRERGALVKELRAPLLAHAGGGPWQFEARPIFGDAGFLRAVELARLGLGNDARRELAKLGFAAPDSRDGARTAPSSAPARDKDREDVYWIAAILLDRGRLWGPSHAIPRYTLNGYRLSYPAARGGAQWRLAYPRAYAELVEPNSRLNRVPVSLQYAIMREESAFSPRIESPANALGLTQLVVKTAQRFADGRISRDLLLDPAVNLRVGSRFLGFLLDHFRSAVPLAVAGYNAGETAVDGWLKERGPVEMDEFMETIPYDETRNYTKRVLASYFAYAWLYDETAPVPALTLPMAKLPGPAARKGQLQHHR